MYTPYWSDVYHLDLCILAYQLHCQSLKFPFDPYYEDLRDYSHAGIGILSFRDAVMRQVRASNAADFDNSLDPIVPVDRYIKVNPHLPGFAKPYPGQWLLYRAPSEITSRIVRIEIYNNDGQVRSTDYATTNNNNNRDVIYCFIGKTGGSLREPLRSQNSLMGFVLKRYHDDRSPNFDLHIVFRGSRSGKLLSTLASAIPIGPRTGNPDWCTDTNNDNNQIIQEIGGDVPGIHPVKGFARSMIDTFPSIVRCLNAAIPDNDIPNLDEIYIAGHSLGGALALHFKAACTIGKLGENLMTAANTALYFKLRYAKVFTYGAPVTGNDGFANRMNQFDIMRYKIAGDTITNLKLPSFLRFMSPNVHLGEKYRLLVREEDNTGKKISGSDAHEPKWIRKAIIGVHNDLLQNSFLPDYVPDVLREIIPFNDYSNEDIPKNPWRLFKTFNDLKEAIDKIDTNTFRNLLGGEPFKVDAIQYLNYCNNASLQNGDFRKAMTPFIQSLNQANDFEAINNAFNALCETKKLSIHELESIEGILKIVILALLDPSPASRVFVNKNTNF